MRRRERTARVLESWSKSLQGDPRERIALQMCDVSDHHLPERPGRPGHQEPEHQEPEHQEPGHQEPGHQEPELPQRAA
jgi:hypothetical protein